jgi:hypothetical protein
MYQKFSDSGAGGANGSPATTDVLKLGTFVDQHA